MKNSAGILSMFVLAVLAVPAEARADSGWVRIDASAPFIDRDGTLRRPSCSGGPKLVQTPAGVVPVPAEKEFAFFFRAGNPSRLAIFWDGGGSCWDATTCVGSALLGIPTYSLEADETVAELESTGGLGDFDNPENPIASYTQVFIPYCTADLHTGAADTLYQYELPDGTVVPWLIHHRGFDNVAAVLRWLDAYYRNEIGRPPSRAFFAGASAGGYGVLYGFPAASDLLPWYARTRVLVDAANGVINQDFYDRALTPGGVWGVWDNLAPELGAAFASGPDELLIRIFRSLGGNYPNARFGQYTTAFDETQIFFYNVARNLDSVEKWFDPFELAAAGFEWTLRARTYMILTALQTWNYRFYLARGTDHTIVADDKFYLEDSAGGVAFVDWLDDMINRFWPWGSDWRNLSCAPNCLP